MKKRKRLMALGMAAAMTTLAIAGCSGSGTPTGTTEASATTGGGTTTTTAAEGSANEVKKTGLPIVDQQETLKVMVLTNYPELKGEDVVIHQEIQADTNVKIEFEIIPATSWEEKKGLTLAQSELPDIIMGNTVFTDTDMLNMAAAGQILPLEGLLEEYGENFKALCENEPGLQASLRTEDGHIYALPNYIGIGDGNGPGILSTNLITYINQTWLDKLGLAMPTTTEEFEKVMVAFKNEDPNGNGINDEIPLTTVSNNFYFDDYFGAFGIIPQNNENAYKNIGVKDGKTIFSAVQEEYKDAIKYFNNLWQQGVLDPEAFTQDSTMFNAKLKNPTRTVGAFTCWRGTSWRLSSEDTEYAVMPPLTGPNGDKLYAKMYNGINSRCAFVITSSCKNPELAMRWGDYLLEPDIAYQFWTKAKIGYNIEENSSGTFDLIKQMVVDDPEQMKQVEYGFTCVDAKNEARKPKDPDPLNVDNEKAAADKLFKDAYPEEHYPNVFLTMEESKKIAELGNDIDAYVEQCYAKWITKGGIDEEWDDYIQKLNNMKLEEYIAQYQSALERYQKSFQ